MWIDTHAHLSDEAFDPKAVVKQCEEEGWMLPVVHAEVDYKKPARYDDLLEVTAWCSETRGVRMKISCEVKVNGELLVSGFTTHCFVSVKTFRPMPPPEKFLEALEVNE